MKVSYKKILKIAAIVVAVCFGIAVVFCSVFLPMLKRSESASADVSSEIPETMTNNLGLMYSFQDDEYSKNYSLVTEFAKVPGHNFRDIKVDFNVFIRNEAEGTLGSIMTTSLFRLIGNPDLGEENASDSQFAVQFYESSSWQTLILYNNGTYYLRLSEVHPYLYFNFSPYSSTSNVGYQFFVRLLRIFRPSILSDMYIGLGYDNGYSTGENGAYDKGYQAGIIAGNEAAYDEGYSQGYGNGYNKGSSDSVSNPLNLFLEPAHQFMNIKIFGSFAVADFFNVVLFVGVAIIFIKMFSGG